MNRPTRRRGRGGPGITTIFWRDIPSQITATTADGETTKVLLEPRFQHAIDRAAHVAGLTDTDDYIQQWRRVAGPLEGEAGVAAKAAADTIDSDYPRDRLEALVASGGLAPAPAAGPDTNENQ
jgi:cvfA/B/C family virulence factor